MERIENEQSAQLQEVMRTFPHWIMRWGWLSILLVVMLVGGIGYSIRYPETVTLPIELLTVRSGAGNARVYGQIALPATGQPGVKIGQAVRIRFSAESREGGNRFADGIVSTLTPRPGGGQTVTVELIPGLPQGIPPQTTGTARITLRQKRLIEAIRF